MELTVIGSGRLGLQLAAEAVERGIPVRAVRGRRPVDPATRALLPDVAFDTWSEPAAGIGGSLVVMAVPDHAIASAAEALASGAGLAGTAVLHTSGLHTAGLLEPCRKRGAAVASWHPLLACPPLALGRAHWQDVWTAVEGDPGGRRAAAELSRRLGCRAWEIDPGAKPLYHAAAAVAANLTHVLAAEAARILTSCGLPEPEDALGALVHGSLGGALRHPDLSALTGPMVRGDEATLRRHLEVLPPPLAEVYRTLAELVRRRGGG